MITHTHSLESPPRTDGLLIRWAPFYDSVVDVLTLGHTRRLRNVTIDAALLDVGESVLDVGCGTGGVTIPAAERVGPRGLAAGIDPSPEMIAVARSKADRLNLKVDFRIGVIESLPYPDGSFDAVTSSLMMHHLTPELQVKGIAEIYRVLKPGGRLLIADTTIPRGFFLKRVFGLIARRHGVKFGVEDLTGVLKSAGFAGVNVLEMRFLMLGFVLATKQSA
jgi:demethylmenaquinone methyltransferase/2-methoxy-6-polyprenyl-1,4-benzoquinol methylase/phosphoethanolamine N-methyltransferase